MIAAVEGAADVHSEYALLADVTVAGEGASFNDLPHFAGGIVPGDGIFTTWSYRAGAGRAEAFPAESKADHSADRLRMGNSRGNCSKWQGARSGVRACLALPEGSRSHAPKHARTLFNR